MSRRGNERITLVDRERPTLPPDPPIPPRPLLDRPIVRVKFRDFGPAEAGSTRTVRELTATQGKLEQHALGVVVHGVHLVPWSNIYWVEYEAQ